MPSESGPGRGAEPHYLDCAGRTAAGAEEARRRRLVGEFFARGGFPTAADEDWRHSGLDLTRALYRPFEGAPPANGAPPDWTEGFADAVRLRNGLVESVSAPLGGGAGGGAGGGVNLGAFGRGGAALSPAARRFGEDGAGAESGGNGPGADAEGALAHPLETLNAALSDCGARLEVPAGADCPPVLLHSSRSGEPGAERMLHPRFFVELGAGSRAVVIEAHEGGGAHEGGADSGWTNPSAFCRIGENAELHYLRLDREPEGVAHTGRVTFELGRDARLRCAVFSLGAGRSRTEARALLQSEGADAELNGLFLGAGAAAADHHTLVVHAAPRGSSRQLFKSVLAEGARAVFDGKVVVTPGAVGTDAAQSNRTLLLSRRAETHTRPRLEINADDVKCAHGAAIGRLDEDALFYLRSRGLGAMDSREILIRAFAGEVIERAGAAPVRALAEAELAAMRPRWSETPA